MTDSDVSVFFEQQLDDEANRMAAFTSEHPADRRYFDEHWAKNRSEPSGKMKTIVLPRLNGAVAGYVLSYLDRDLGQLEVAYWIGREYWGRGVATAALREFLSEHQRSRPIYARVAKDNFGSYRVLVKCNFRPVGEGRGFANASGKEVEEHIMKLDDSPWPKRNG